jgi:hypothetical protein
VMAVSEMKATENTLIFPAPLPAQCRVERPGKGALMQTFVCVRQGFRALHHDEGRSCPSTQTNPTRIGCRERFAVPSRRREEAPSPRPHPTVRRLDARQGFRALHRDRERRPLRPHEAQPL